MTCTYFCFSNTDMPTKTATGTIAIQVEDFNDHCPTLTSNFQTICTTADSVIVSAKDEDSFPNGPPFDFAIVPEGTKGKWQVEHLNGEENTANKFVFATDCILQLGVGKVKTFC